MNPFIRLAALAALSCSALASQAAPVDLRFNATVTFTTDGAPALGTAVSGRVSYDTEPGVTDLFGSKLFTWSTPTSFTLDVGDVHYSAMMVAGALLLGAGEETLQLQGLNYSLEDGLSLSPRLMLAFTGSEGAFGGTVPTALNVGDFTVHAGGVFMVDELEPRLMFELSSVTAVPEPSAVLAAVAGLMTLAAARRRMPI